MMTKKHMAHLMGTVAYERLQYFEHYLHFADSLETYLQGGIVDLIL